MFNQETGDFDVVWDGLFSNAVELSLEEFEQKYGINALQFDEDLTENNAPESNCDEKLMVFCVVVIKVSLINTSLLPASMAE